MKTLLTAAAAVATIATATPAFCAPQWVQIGEANTEINGIYANYNSARGTGRVRSVDVTVDSKVDGIVAVTVHVDCPSWRWAMSATSGTGKWDPIGRNSAAEGAAQLICPAAKDSPVPAAGLWQ
jgi:hypothetical protein